MNKIFLAGLALALLAGGVASSVAASPYVSGSFGLVSASDSSLSGESGTAGDLSMDSGFGFLAAVGNKFDGLRGEAEIAYRTNDLNKTSTGPATGEITSLSFLGNLLIDFPLSENLQPFLGAGMGLAQVDSGSADLNNANDTVFAYQLIAGIGFPLTYVTTIDLQYRYFATANPDFSGIEAEYETHNFFAGLRFDF
jgi:opacity protein-like surface antigen